MVFVVLLISMFASQLVMAQTVTIVSSAPSICQGSGTQVTLTAQTTGTVLTYAWSDGTTGIDFIEVSPAATTNYTVTVTFLSSPAATATATVTVLPTPTPTISASGSTTICQGTSVTLTSSISNPTCEWYFNGVVIPGSLGMTSYPASQAGSYRVYVTVGSCSGMSAPTTVTVNPLPNASFTPNVFLDECGSAITPFTADLTGPQYTYQWYQRPTGIGTYTAIPGATGPTLNFDTPTTSYYVGDYEYSVQVTDIITTCTSTW